MAGTRQDAGVVLALWVGRRAFAPLLVAGVAFAWWAGEEMTAGRYFRLESPTQLVQALFTPLVGVALALLVRALVSLAAMLSAFPRTRWASSSQAMPGLEHRDGPVKRWVDRYYLTAAYRELRWSWTVRGRAAELLGRSERWLDAVNVVLWLLLAATVVGLVVVVVLVSGRA